MPIILSIDQMKDEKQLNEFFELAFKKLEIIAGEKDAGKLDTPEKESEKVNSWAKEVFKDGIGINFADSYTYSTEMLSNIVQGVYIIRAKTKEDLENPSKRMTPYTDWDKAFRVSGVAAPYNFLKLLLEAALSPYPDGRPKIDKLWEYMEHGPSVDNPGLNYYFELKKENIECSKNAEKQKQVIEIKEPEVARKKEFNKENFNEAQQKIDKLESAVDTLNKENASLKQKLSAQDETLAKLMHRLEALESTNVQRSVYKR